MIDNAQQLIEKMADTVLAAVPKKSRVDVAKEILAVFEEFGVRIEKRPHNSHLRRAIDDNDDEGDEPTDDELAAIERSAA